MKLYGYSNNTEATPMALSEVSIGADPAILRKIASFISKCADEIEQDPENWEHVHFNDQNNTITDEMPHLIVFNPSVK